MPKQVALTLFVLAGERIGVHPARWHHLAVVRVVLVIAVSSKFVGAMLGARLMGRSPTAWLAVLARSGQSPLTE